MLHQFKTIGRSALTAVLALGISVTSAQAASVTVSDSTSATLNESSAPCTSPITRIFSISDTFNVTQLQLGLNVTHTYRGDLQLQITKGATTVTAIAVNNGDGNNNYDILVTSGSNAPLDNNIDDNVSAPLYDRIVGPSNSLSSFIGQPANGTWEITLCDALNGDSGTYNSLQLTLSDPPLVDLDSSDTSGTGYQGSFNIDVGGPVRAADSDVSISNSGDISSATIQLTSRPDGNSNESLDIDVTGIGDLIKNYNATTGELTVSSASGINPGTFANVLSTLEYNNISSTPTTGSREITVVIEEMSGSTSNTAISNIDVYLPNPDFSLDCSSSSFEVTPLFILDDSGSVSAAEQQLQRQAVMDTIDYFINNNITATVGIVRFSTSSSRVIDFTPVTPSTRSQFITALDTNYGTTGSGGTTNWQAAFEEALSLANDAAPAIVPNLTFFFTDGTQNSGVESAAEAASVGLQDLGTHIYAVGIEDLAGNTSVFERVTDGPDTSLFQAPLGNTETADVVAITDFNQLRDEFSSFISTFCPTPNILLVKRITEINGQDTNPIDGTNLSQVVDDTSSPFADSDSNPRWPTDFLKGAIDAGAIKPGDEIEYTIYFYNVGAGEAEEVYFCDRLQPALTFVQGAYGPDQDVELELGNDPNTNPPNTVTALTAANDGLDRAQLIPAGQSVPTQCNLNAANDNGTLVLQITGNTGTPSLTTLPGSPSPDTTESSYGAFRFKVRVE